MSFELGLVFVCLGLIGGSLSGLLGIGGGLVLIPLLLYVPEWLGLAAIEIRTAAAITVVQVAAATLSGGLAHRRRGLVHPRLALSMSVASASGALLGGVTSAYVASQALLLATAMLATGAAALMVVPVPTERVGKPAHSEFNLVLAVALGFGIGVVIGMNGSGAFLMVPSLIYLLEIPTRVAVGSVLAIGFPTALAALIGKVATGQVPLWPSAAVVLGAVPGAQLGSLISVRVSARALRLTYGTLVLVIAAGLWYDVFHTNP